MGRIPFVKITAKNNYDFGFKLGSALKKSIQYRIKENQHLYKKRTIKYEDPSIYIQKAKKFLPAVKKTFPNLLKEVQGMADGSGVSFEKLLFTMCDEEIVDFKIYPQHCTSIAIRTPDNKILVGHNEDWFPEYRKDGVFLVNGKIKNNKFLGLGYMGNLAGSAFGLNKHGIAYTDNSLEAYKISYDIPRCFHLRSLLEVKNPKEALRVLDKEGSMISSTLITWSNIKVVDIEELQRHDEIFSNKNLLFHTNHPLNPKNQNKRTTPPESLIRYKRVTEFMNKAKIHDKSLLIKILKDHKAEICGHRRVHNPPSYTVTIASVIMNPKDKWLLLCDTNPCKGVYKKYRL